LVTSGENHDEYECKLNIGLFFFLLLKKKVFKADTLKATEANRRRGPGITENVRSKRINLEGKTHAQEINVSQPPE
jgi:hypothetical protein